MNKLLLETFYEILKEKKVFSYEPRLVEACLDSLVNPIDHRRWPNSWKKTSKRLKNVLDEKEDMYWRALQVSSVIPYTLITDWNALVEMPSSKRLRVVGVTVDLIKLYPNSRFLWDLIVLDVMKGKRDLTSVIKASVRKSNNLSMLYPKWVIRSLQFIKASGAPEPKKGTAKRLEILEDGNA